jgi:hypothetical protein
MKRSWLLSVIWLCVGTVASSPVCAQGESGSIVLRGSVSKTVSLSLSPDASHTRVELNAIENNGVLNVLLSGSGFERNVEVPILIRSNVSYNLTASIQSQNAVSMKLRVLSVEPTGMLVARGAVTGVAVDPLFDMRRGDSFAGDEGRSTIDDLVPFTILSGSRISLGGGLKSPNNALKVILLLSVQPNVEKGNWTVNLKLQGSATDTR